MVMMLCLSVACLLCAVIFSLYLLATSQSTLLNSFYGNSRQPRQLHSAQTPSAYPNLQHPQLSTPTSSHVAPVVQGFETLQMRLPIPWLAVVAPHTHHLRTYLPISLVLSYPTELCSATLLFQALTHAVAEMFLKPRQSHRKSASC